jgi:hypothetical protein
MTIVRKSASFRRKAIRCQIAGTANAEFTQAVSEEQ